VVGVSTYVRLWLFGLVLALVDIYVYICVCVYVKKSSLLLLLCVYVCKPTSPTYYLPSKHLLTSIFIYLSHLSS